MDLMYEEETFAIRGAVFEVYREMGCGFLEAVYQECLEKELRLKGIPFVSQPELMLSYKGESLQQVYKPDLICYEQIIVELKAVKELAQEHKAQVNNYLKATNLSLKTIPHTGSPGINHTRLFRNVTVSKHDGNKNLLSSCILSVWWLSVTNSRMKGCPAGPAGKSRCRSIIR